MSLFDNIFDTPPDFTNKAGIKWWLDKMSTRYAQEENLKNGGVALPNVRVFSVEEVNGNRTRLILEGSEIVFEDPSLEGIAVHLDIMKLAKTS